MIDYSEKLKTGVYKVVFTKVNGTERVLIGTLCPILLPVSGDEGTNYVGVTKVYDLEAEGWRAFRDENVKSFERIEGCLERVLMASNLPKK